MVAQRPLRNGIDSHTTVKWKHRKAPLKKGLQCYTQTMAPNLSKACAWKKCQGEEVGLLVPSCSFVLLVVVFHV